MLTARDRILLHLLNHTDVVKHRFVPTDDITLPRIREILDCSYPHVSKSLKTMSDEGLLDKWKGKHSHRLCNCYRLTPKGISAAKNIESRVEWK